MIQAGKRKKEFADPYTVTGAVTKGNIITKLSLLIMGLGNIAHRQIAKGLMFLVVEIGYIWFMIQSGIYNLSMFPSLGHLLDGESRKKSGMKRKVSMSTLPVISHP